MPDLMTFPRHRGGRKGHGLKRTCLNLQADLLEWAVQTEEGLSVLLRRLLREEYERQQDKGPRPHIEARR